MKQSKSNYLPKAERLFSFEATKPQQQQIKIIEAAIRSYAVHGIEKTTYTSLAKMCEISRPLVHHYFPTLDSLFLLAAKYVRETLLRCATEEINQHPEDEMKQLKSYIDGCFRWVRLFPHQARFWMLYYYQTSHDQKARTDNSLMVKAGHLRIKKLIESGKIKKIFTFKDSLQTSKAIQILITGAIVSLLTEDDYLNLENAADLVFRHALCLIKN